MMPIYLGVGSNSNRHKNISAGLTALAELLGNLTRSTVYESKSIGFDGSNFFNLVVGASTQLSIAALSAALKHIEDNNGRIRNGSKFSSRSLDIDILTYGNFVGIADGVELPRAEILKNAFVLLPLAELAPNVLHPQLQQTYAELWANYDKTSQSLWPIEFEQDTEIISPA